MTRIVGQVQVKLDQDAKGYTSKGRAKGRGVVAAEHTALVEPLKL